MKPHIIITIAWLLFTSALSFAQNPTDTLRTRARQAELSLKRNQLKQRIAAEDKQRNLQMPGVTPEQMELINLRQDSLCLELRSQLTDIELEMAELATFPQYADGTAIPSGEAAVMQQVIQALKPNRIGHKEEKSQEE